MSDHPVAKESRHVNLGFVEEPFPEGIHMCLIYNDEAERRAVIGRFIDQGLKDGHVTSYFGDAPDTTAIRQELEEIGVHLPEDDSDQDLLHISQARHTYCPQDQFDPDRILASLGRFHDSAQARGHAFIRVSGEMGWALRGYAGSNRLFEYESRVNDFMTQHPFAAICQYDARRFSGDAILAAMKVHPVMVIRGQIVHNPFYMETAAFRQDKQFDFQGQLGMNLP
ncbi:MAG: MEDS domain-containing protein [Magnetococcales bacterium]|nr:MEDS domain-containing protein [Magnetococcales bacterium]